MTDLRLKFQYAILILKFGNAHQKEPFDGWVKHFIGFTNILSATSRHVQTPDKDFLGE